jgi:P-type conjugative transfer protein TrbJ
MNTRIILPLALTMLGFAFPARAQMAVFDAANFAQAVQEVESATQEVTNLEQQLSAQEKMIQDLPGTVAPGLVTLAQQTQQLMQQVNTIQSMGTNLNNQLQSLYPTDYSNDSFTGILSQIASMQSAQRQAYKTSMAMQSQVTANQGTITAAYKAADTESMAAAGPTQAVQADTQAVEAVGQQLGDIQSLMIAQQNADAQKAVAAQSEDAAAQAAQTQIWQYSPPQTVSAVNPFSDVGN